MPTIHLIIKGKVQGVFYRATAKAVADDLGITGWIKNREDGNVEVMASGEKNQIQRFEAWCHQGPKNANVEEVVSLPKGDIVFRSFTVKH